MYYQCQCCSIMASGDTFLRPTECTSLRHQRRSTKPDFLAPKVEETPSGPLASSCIQPEQACNKPTIPAVARWRRVHRLWQGRDTGGTAMTAPVRACLLHSEHNHAIVSLVLHLHFSWKSPLLFVLPT